MSEQEKKSKKNFPLWGVWAISSAALLLALFSMLLFSVFPKKVQKNDEQPTYVAIVDDESQLPDISKISGNNSISNEEKNSSSFTDVKEDSVVQPLPINPVPVKSAPIKNKFDIPTASNGATLVFIFDDAGQSLSKMQKYSALPFPITVAVLPKLPHSVDCAEDLRKNGKEVMLHQPMQALNLSINPGPGAITPEMDNKAIMATIKENIDSISPIKGMNNHEGSLITGDLSRMIAVMQVALEKNIYFVDSRTTADTKVQQAGLMVGVTVYSNDVFLDNKVEKEAILKQIYRGLAVANTNGRAVMIGHIDKSVNIIPQLLSELYPVLVQNGYKFATLSQYNQ